MTEHDMGEGPGMPWGGGYYGSEIGVDARRVFVDASIDYPAAIEAQAADIALKLRIQDKTAADVSAMHKVAVTDVLWMDSVAASANRVHSLRDNEKIPRSVTPGHVRNIAGDVFWLAQFFIELMSDEELKEVRDRFFDLRREAGRVVIQVARVELDRELERRKACES